MKRLPCWFGEWLELYWWCDGMQYDDTYWHIIVANVKRMLINPEGRMSLIHGHWFNMAWSYVWLWVQSAGIYGRWKVDWRQHSGEAGFPSWSSYCGGSPQRCSSLRHFQDLVSSHSSCTSKTSLVYNSQGCLYSTISLL